MELAGQMWPDGSLGLERTTQVLLSISRCLGREVMAVAARLRGSGLLKNGVLSSHLENFFFFVYNNNNDNNG